MFTKKNLIFPMPKGNPLEYLNDVLKYEHSFLEYLEGQAHPANIAYETYATRVKTGAPIAEIEGMAQVIQYIENLPLSEREKFLCVIRENVESASDDVEVEINETVFGYSDGTTRTVDVVGELSGSSYSVPSGAALIGAKIGKNVTTIGSYAFCNCNSLTSVDIPGSVTTIGSYAFQSCTSLTSITIPGSVTTIGKWAFSYCSALTSVVIPDSVTSIGSSTFYNCYSLTSVDIQNGVETIGDQAFYGCTSLTSIDIPSSVTTINEWAFSNCTALTPVTIPSSVAIIGNGAFYLVPHIYYKGSATGSPWNALAVN